MRRGLPSAEAAQTSFFKSTLDCGKMRKDKSYEIYYYILSVQPGLAQACSDRDKRRHPSIVYKAEASELNQHLGHGHYLSDTALKVTRDAVRWLHLTLSAQFLLAV